VGAELRFALAAVASLPHHPAQARSSLADICARHRVSKVIDGARPRAPVAD
jgi:hypothetical protein